MIYLDNAATTLIKPASVGMAVSAAMRSLATPGRGGHAPAMRAAETVYACREEAAALFHLADPERVVFTLNATHALNLAIRSLAKPGDPVVISGYEHNAVTRPLHALGAKLRVAGAGPFDRQRILTDFERLLPGAKLAVCTHVSNVFGYTLPVYELAELCREKGVPLIVDASQSAGVLELDMERLGAAFLAMPGHKSLFGPQGTGLLLCAAEGEPLLFGGSGSDSVPQTMPDYLPDRLEAGTQNVCGIAGLLEGLRYVRQKGTAEILRHERGLLRRMLDGLAGTEYELFTGGEQTGVLSLRCARCDSESLAAALAERGICVRAGLHCAPLAHRSAGTLESGTVRFSFSPFVTGEQIDRTCQALRRLEGERI